MARIPGVDADEFNAAVKQQGFCSEWIYLNPNERGGPYEFACECQRFSGIYPDVDSGVAALDGHLDEQEAAVESFCEIWIAEHRTDGTSGRDQRSS